jgi:capsular exopolysaccharide synthesis family protein/TonB family protein
MKEVNNSYKLDPQVEGFSPEVSLREVSLQRLPGSRLYSQQDGGASGLEQLRELVHSLDLQRGKPFKRVLITSAVGGEGKTHVAANLSLSLAAEGVRRVLVIDCDVRNPSLHLAFGIPNVFGFKDCLANENKCWNAVQKVKDFELYIITGGIGSCSSIGPARIAGVQMLLDQLEPFFDLIILDSPPLLGGVDGKLLSTVADSILLVVGSGQAPRRLVVQAQQSLQKDKVLGVILNRLDPTMACFRSYSEYGSTRTVKGDGKTAKQGSLEGRNAKSKDLEPEPEVRRETTIIPISLHEEATREPREAFATSQLVTSQDISPVASAPRIAAEERRYEPVRAATPPATPKMRDLITGAVKFGEQLPSQVEVPERDRADVAPPEATASVHQNRRRTPEYFNIALLLAVVTIAGILGWALGQSGARYYRRQSAPVKQPASVQSATSVKSDILASGTPATALTTPQTLASQTAVSAGPLPKPSNPAPGERVLYNDDKLVIRSDQKSPGNYAKASRAGTTTGHAVAGATATLRIPPGIARQYLTSEVAPEYPEPARDEHIEGPVVLNVQVDKSGRVQKLTTISGNPLLAAAATNGVQRWRFRPIYRNGQAEEFETQVTVNFKLPVDN